MYVGLGILPVIVTTAVNLLVPAIEQLFKSNTPLTFPQKKQMIDTWAGIVNLDPTFMTASAQWAWANLRCLAGDAAASADVTSTLKLFPLKYARRPVGFRETPDGLIPDNFINPCTNSDAAVNTYALAAVRVLTTAAATNPKSDSLYGGTLPVPLPKIPVPNPNPNPNPTPNILGVSPMALALLGVVGLGAVVLLSRGGRR